MATKEGITIGYNRLKRENIKLKKEIKDFKIKEILTYTVVKLFKEEVSKIVDSKNKAFGYLAISIGLNIVLGLIVAYMLIL